MDLLTITRQQIETLEAVAEAIGSWIGGAA